MENDKLVWLSDVVDELNEWYAMYPDSDTAREALALAKKSIRRLPAVDAVEVRHAYWIDIKGTNGKDYLMCSDCHHEQEITGVKNYCAVCGARMDGEDGDGDG